MPALKYKFLGMIITQFDPFSDIVSIHEKYTDAYIWSGALRSFKPIGDSYIDSLVGAVKRSYVEHGGFKTINLIK